MQVTKNKWASKAIDLAGMSLDQKLCHSHSPMWACFWVRYAGCWIKYYLPIQARPHLNLVQSASHAQALGKNWDQNQWSQITWITVHQRNQQILFCQLILAQCGFPDSFDAPWSKWFRITHPDFPKECTLRLCLAYILLKTATLCFFFFFFFFFFIIN